MVLDLSVRPFRVEDAPDVARLLATAFGGFEDEFPGAKEALARGPELLAQTGARLLVAAGPEERAIGVVRWTDEEGIGTFDLLCGSRPGSGRLLVRAVERAAQDAGIRFLRCAIPVRQVVLEDYFARLGYRAVSRTGGSAPLLTIERRLPLLTVREQRRSDAEAIAALTGEDPWPFEQGHRPGWFVLADGERVAGAVTLRTARDGRATLTPPWLAAGYRGRGLELWMAERALSYAATNGMLSVSLAVTPELEPYERSFEDRRWFRKNDVFVRDLNDEEFELPDPLAGLL